MTSLQVGRPAVSTEEAACFYACTVMHQRRVAPYYRFLYRVFYLLADVDRVAEAGRGLRLFSHNRFNLLSFHNRDHGDGSGELRGWAESRLAEAGIELAGGRIRLLAMPRLCGHAFNPISLWYCEHADGSLRAVIAEVRNTFGEKHCYLLADDGMPLAWMAPLYKDKCFHVSPFFDLVGSYRFVLYQPDEKLRVSIRETREGQPIFDAGLYGGQRALSDSAILRLVLAMPLMTLKVVAGIHWQALKLWLRGARFHRKPEPPRLGIS